MTGPDAGRMRTVEFRGEIWLSRADLFEEIDQAVKAITDPRDQDVAQNLIRWLAEATRSEP